MKSIRHMSAALLLATGIAAQTPEPALLEGLRVPIHSASDDLGTPYGTWAAGDAYKVSFHDGMTFVPYLGSDYPRNRPWSWRTTSVRVGEHELLAPGAAPTHRHTDYRCEYDLGGVTEVYDVRAEGLEQSFVVERLPGPGDLVITGSVTSALTAEPRGLAHAGLEFRDESGAPILRYGEAFAIDAAGRRIPIETAVDGAEIGLRVPAAFVAAATLPITVDPLIGATLFHSSTTGGYVRNVSIARQPSLGLYNKLLCFVRAASQYDDDVYAYSYHHWTPIYTPAVVYTDITTNWDSDGVSCAQIGPTDQWLIVFRRYFANNPIRVSQLRCHARLVHGASSTSVGSLTPPAGFNDIYPEVGGIEQSSNRQAAVVFQREDNTNTVGHWAQSSESRIHCAIIDPSIGGGTFLSTFQVHGGTGLDCERPAINKVAHGISGTNVNHWVCACQVYGNNIAGDDWDVQAKRITSQGGVTGGTWYSDLAGQNTDHQLAPAVAGTNGRYAIAFATTDLVTTPTRPNNTAGQKVWIERFDWAPNSSFSSGDRPPVELASDTARTFEVGGVGHDTVSGSHFAVGYSTGSPSPSAEVVRVGYSGNIVEGPLQLTSGAVSITPPDCVFEPARYEFLCGYAERNNTTNPVCLNGLSAPTGGLVSYSGSSCNSVILSWQGSRFVGAELSRITASGAQPGAGHFMIVSLAVADLPVNVAGVAPGCRLLVDAAAPSFLGTLPFQTGTAPQWAFPLPEFLPPLTLYFQDWTFASSVFASSHRANVDVIR